MKEILWRHAFIYLALALAVSMARAQTNASCSGMTYYVSNSGSDTNSGTSTGSPWKTVAKVVSFEPSLVAGNCVLFQQGGVWYEQLTISNIHGTQSAPITFSNYGSGNLPVLDGGSTRLYGIVDGEASGQVASSYVTIDGFEVRNATSGGIIFAYLQQVGITIQNNYVHNNGYGAYAGACAGCYQVDSGNYGYNEGISMVCYSGGASTCGVKILNNIVQAEGGHNALMVDSDKGSPLVQGNTVGPGCSHNCFDWKRSIGIVTKQNIANCSGTVTVNGQSYPACNNNAFYTQSTTDFPFTATGTYEQNIAYGAAPGSGCYAQGGESGPQTTSLNYYNNTCAFPAGTSSPVAFAMSTCVGGTLKVYNNIFQGGFITVDTTNCITTWDYNDKYQTTGSPPSGAHDLAVNPLWVNPSALDFHLQSTSSVLNAGNSSILGLAFMGADGTSGTTGSAPAAPTGLTVTVQ